MEAEKPADKRPRTKYDAAFRTKAIRRVNQDGQEKKQLQTQSARTEMEYNILKKR